MPIHVKVLYFGQTRDASGRAEEDFTLPKSAHISVLLEKARSKHSKLGRFEKSMQIALNEEIADGDELLKDGDVVAMIPPVAGG